ncbi:hypothetical protein KAK05_02905, partial [Candidatus Parcubacteria bacterium]|nr:hypothetical protein [Candidatus Parcubacteria bacterium]
LAVTLRPVKLLFHNIRKNSNSQMNELPRCKRTENHKERSSPKRQRIILKGIKKSQVKSDHITSTLL